MKKKYPRVGIVLNATQPNATFENFNEDLFKKKIVEPAQALLGAYPWVHRIVLVVMCDPKLDCAEKWKKDFLPEEGIPKQTISPTSKATIKHLFNKEINGRVQHFNIFGENFEANMQYGANFAKREGVELVLKMDALPTPRGLLQKLEKALPKSAKKIRPNHSVAHA